MTVKRMDNVGIVVEDIDAAIEFFTELGFELEGRAPIEGDWADGVTKIGGQIFTVDKLSALSSRAKGCLSTSKN